MCFIKKLEDASILPLEKDEDLFKNNPKIIAVTDVHLGAFYNCHERFYDFMVSLKKKREANELGNLEAFIITGDFFDLMMDSYEDLKEYPPYYVETYSILNWLQLEQNVKIYLTLGNHEISLLRSFKKVKKNFIKDFGENQPCLFINNAQLCQYLIIEQFSDKPLRIEIFDVKRKIKKFIPDESAINRLLFSHGHQLTTLFSLFCGITSWSPLLNAPDKIKEISDLLWNFPNGPITIETVWQVFGQMENDMPPQRAEKMREYIQNHEQEIVKLIEKIKKTNGKTHKLKGLRTTLNKNVVRMVSKRKMPHIDNFVFGHTHVIYKEKWGKKNGKQVWISNIGAWQYVNDPYYAEIDSSGFVQPYKYLLPAKEQVMIDIGTEEPEKYMFQRLI